MLCMCLCACVCVSSKKKKNSRSNGTITWWTESVLWFFDTALNNGVILSPAFFPFSFSLSGLSKIPNHSVIGSCSVAEIANANAIPYTQTNTKKKIIRKLNIQLSDQKWTKKKREMMKLSNIWRHLNRTFFIGVKKKKSFLYSFKI